ncbi:DNA gyrase inhibitor YacG [Leptolyngbya sp. 7M]|uniref:DNA gyrase inhibitor YacG n=1 Tax=Leptolyngbya sp. 7M TaxID=2812896 RepID=UPI001B8CFADD|nr:DNA gyrase inhibitor YacG [Leptolyngbya sp. 7M]QYO66053.1 DNA gyrase inhibitor YacG [Leptolyngbya sp. 7M]
MTFVKCPSCGKQTQYEDNDHRPFCSERCKLIDFGAWIDEEYALPVESVEMTEEDLELLQKAEQLRK